MRERGQGLEVRGYARWNCTFVANGESCEVTKERFGGMWSAGSGPLAANDVRFSAVMTGKSGGQRFAVQKRITKRK